MTKNPCLRRLRRARARRSPCRAHYGVRRPRAPARSARRARTRRRACTARVSALSGWRRSSSASAAPIAAGSIAGLGRGGAARRGHLGDVLDAAEAAAGAPAHRALARQMRLQLFAGQRDRDPPAVGAPHRSRRRGCPRPAPRSPRSARSHRRSPRGRSGVAIITAKGEPPMTICTGASTATARVSGGPTAPAS